MVYATQTTLGADNGIALAYCLALLASTDIPHPPLEMLATVEEETGMGGAAALDPQLLKGRYLINIDSEEEGKLLVSCAGGARIIHSLPIEREPSKDEYLACLISICGLKGGHSGMEIHKGRGNANKLMGRILNDMADKLNFSIAEINGGAKMNAIPRESDAIIVLDPKDFPLLRDTISEWDSILKNEYCVSDPGISIHLKQLKETIAHVFSKKTGEAVISTLMLTPDGVQTMSMEIEGLVESSTNLGVVTMMKNRLLFESAVRSSVRSRKYSIIAQLKQIAQVLGLQFTIDSDYPEWEYNPHSTLLKIFKEVHHNQYGKDPEITAIHAGLECGLLKEKKPELDMISFGPNIYDVHTPDEHFSISSVKRTWEYLLAVLQEIR